MTRNKQVIAILDDEEGLRVALRRLLSPRGYDVKLFDTGKSLIDACEERDISAIILDLHMPVMNGFEVLEALSGIPSAPPVILITGHDQPGNPEKATRLGAHAYLTKPIDQAPLLEALSGIFKNPSRPSAP